MQIFIQIDGLIIDVSKVTHMQIGRAESLTVHFAGGTKTTLKASDARQFLATLHSLGTERDRRLMCVVAKQHGAASAA